MSAVPLPLRFQVGARTLASIQRQLVRVPLGLEDALGGHVPVLPELPRDAHGYAVTSLAEPRHDAMVAAGGPMLAFVRQRYTRYHADLTIGVDQYLARMSGSTRAGLRRKARRLAEVSGGKLDVRSYTGVEGLQRFHDIARAISARTYQEKLLGAGLPDDATFLARMAALAAANRVRAWTLHIAGEPAAYLYCPARGDTLLYEYVGHDPAFNDLSPGGVLMMEAMAQLLDERRFARFDFTEGEGQHKRQFATGGVPCLDMLLLRPSLTNRMTTAALGGFDSATALAKRWSQNPALKGLAKKVRRAS